MALLPDSPAIDRGSSDLIEDYSAAPPESLIADQRSFPRINNGQVGPQTATGSHAAMTWTGTTPQFLQSSDGGRCFLRSFRVP